MGRRKSVIITDMAWKIMALEPQTSQDIYTALRSEGHYYLPTVREITFALRADKRFKEIGKVKVGSILRSRSHNVCLWGRIDINYN